TLQPYIKNVPIFRCPSSVIPEVKIDFPNRMTASIGMNSYLGLYFNYYYYFTCPDENPSCYPRPITDPLIKYPAVTAIFTDGFDRTVSGRTPRGYWIDAGYGKGVRFGLSDRHSQGSNLVLIDGHAKWYRTNSVLSQASINEQDDIYVEKANYNAAKI